MRKKFLSLLLALVIAVMVLPMTALAATTSVTPNSVDAEVNGAGKLVTVTVKGKKGDTCTITIPDGVRVSMGEKDLATGDVIVTLTNKSANVTLSVFANELGEKTISFSNGGTCTVNGTCKHENLKAVEANVPTCKVAGNEAYQKCPRCESCFDMEGNLKDESEFVIPADAKAHEKGEHKEGTPATCTATGTKEYWVCKGCTKMLDKDGNVLKKADLVAPIDPTNHAGELQNKEAKKPTCKEYGNEAYIICGGPSGCGFCFTEDDHTPRYANEFNIAPVADAHVVGQKQPAVPATCTQTGKIEWYKCAEKGCNVKLDKNGNVLSAADIKVEKDPTNHSGSEHQTYGRVEPACNEDGHVAYWYCEGCQKCFLEGDEGVTPVTAEDVKIPAVATSHPADQKSSIYPGYPATCKVPGKVNYWHCGACGNNYAESDAEGTKPLLTDADFEIPVNPTAHHADPFVNPGKEATCVEEGNVPYWMCRECGKCFLESDKDGLTEIDPETLKPALNPANHPEGKLKYHGREDATCFADGWDAYWYCSACKNYYTENDSGFENPTKKKNDFKLPQLEHDWVAGEDDTGIAYEVCSHCGQYKLSDGSIIDAIPALHTLDFHQGTPATCTEAGEMDYWYCTDADCGLKFASLEATTPLTDTEIAPLGHDCKPVSNVLINDKWTCYVCTRCGQFFADQYGQNPVETPEDPANHALLHHNAAPASCVSGDGNIEYWECKVCGEFYSDAEGKNLVSESYWVIPYRANNAKNHNLDHKKADDEHIEHYRCLDCGLCFTGNDENATIIDPSDLGNTTNSGVHTLKYYPEVPATCTTEGTKAHWECLVNHGCSKYFADSAAKKIMTKEQMVIPAAHTFIYFKGVEATLDTEGRLGYNYCTTCKMVKLDGSDTLYTMDEARQHWTIEKLPEQSEVQKHTKVDPTCTEDGMKKHWTCKNERTGETEYYLDNGLTQPTTADALVIPALGHDIAADGDHYKCTRCGQLFADPDGNTDYVKPGEPGCKHQEGNRSFVSGTEATCTASGVADHYRCACGQLFDVDGNAVTAQQLSVAPLGHDTVYVKATETTVEYWQCQRCGGIFADAEGRVPLRDTIKDVLDGMDHDLDLGGNWGLSTNGGKDKQP